MAKSFEGESKALRQTRVEEKPHSASRTGNSSTISRATSL
jgi:hypothetical protein